MSHSLPANTIADTRALLQAGKCSAEDPAAACLAMIKDKNPALNAFTITAETAQSTASADGPLANIPIGIKDLIDVAGLPSAAGSPKFFGHEPALKDAFVVAKLKAAGAVIVGKTNTHEIALGITGINPHTGAVFNPHDPRRITGGSSSGSATAVASGMALGALGTDTGGSIRIPAALCGVVGLKPTSGRVSTRGVLPLSWNLDHVGPIAQTVEDAAILLGVIAGYDSQDPASLNVPVDDYLAEINSGVQKWRVALAVGAYVEDCETEVLAAVRSASGVLAGLGAEIVEVEIPRLREAAAANGTMVVADAAAFHREQLAAHPEWFGADVRERLEKGRAVTSTEYALARRTQIEMRRYFDLFFTEYDLLMLPTTAVIAAHIEGLDSAAYAPKLTRFTAPFNLTGLPALSLPCGKSSDGMPIGLQLAGSAWDEAKVLRAGQAFEQAMRRRG